MGLAAAPPDAWLDLLGQNAFGLTRNAAAVTQGLATLTAAASAGPYTIAAGTMWIADAAGHRYSNVNGGVLALGGTLQLTWQAESPGAAYNAANGALTNDRRGHARRRHREQPRSRVAAPGSRRRAATPRRRVAYATRCQNRWPSLARPAPRPRRTYQLWALSAEAAAGHGTTVTKVLVVADATVPGQVDVYLAGTSGAVGGGAVTDVNNYIQARVGITNTAVVAGRVERGDHRRRHRQLLRGADDARGGAGSGRGRAREILQRARHQRRLRQLQGLLEPGRSCRRGRRRRAQRRRLTTNGGSADIALTLGQVATLTNSLTFTGV
jgi:hypothetical protein